MTTVDELVQAVIRDPLSTALRLVTADLMEEEEDHAHAEFIRVQCELASYDGINTGADGGVAGPVHLALRRREQSLLSFSNLVHWVGNADLGRGIRRNHDLPASAILSGEIVLTFRRGFVEAVTITEADFLGSPCGRCGGEKRVPSLSLVWPDSDRPCPTCTGTGRVGGHGPALVAAAPLTSVVLVGKNPMQFRRFTVDEGVYWEPGLRHDAPHQVSFEMAKAGGWKASMIGGLMVYKFATREQAMTALSRAALSWARERAGLPKLAWPEGE